MSNAYRVDRVQNAITPCGMNSILYIGDNPKDAAKAFEAAQIGLDTWGQPNCTYGVIYSIWNSDKREYIVKRIKGL